uniref:transposase n=1 Tax=Mariniphaga anaerophila TaxID=1484053 RepID=UPI0021CF9A49|nr:transposase [Mariniphaga anaerophila]
MTGETELRQKLIIELSIILGKNSCRRGLIKQINLPLNFGLYGLGMSFRDISNHVKEMYDLKISHSTLNEITDRVIPQVKAWQSRPLESFYPIVWLDAMHYKSQG